MGSAQSSLISKGNRAGPTVWSGLGGKTPKPTQLGSGLGWEGGAEPRWDVPEGGEREDGPGTVSVWFLEGRGQAQQCGCGLGGATAKPTQLKRCQRGERNKVRWGTM